MLPELGHREIVVCSVGHRGYGSAWVGDNDDSDVAFVFVLGLLCSVSMRMMV